MNSRLFPIFALVLLLSATFGTTGDECFGQDTYAPVDWIQFRGFPVEEPELEDFIESDNQRARFQPGFTIGNDIGPIWLIFDGFVSQPVDFFFETHAITPGLLWVAGSQNFVTGQLETIAFDDEAFAVDTVHAIQLTSEHIDTDGFVRSFVAWRQIGFVFVFPWEVQIDQVGWISAS